jgi:hypothetical protein
MTIKMDDNRVLGTRVAHSSISELPTIYTVDGYTGAPQTEKRGVAESIADLPENLTMSM